MLNKIALGTVQFGLDYGINNSTGQVSPNEVNNILQLALKNDITTLDTAHAYGNSEATLGKMGLTDFQLISKLPPSQAKDVERLFEESLTRLKCTHIAAYLLHNFNIYEADKNIWNSLKALKINNLTNKIGCSLYHPKELETFWKDGIELDIIQVPYNLFDRSFEPYFEEIKARGTEIHTRSTFLQGLFFKKANNLPTHFQTVQKKLAYIQQYASDLDQSIAAFCLQFSLRNKYIDKVVIGVDSVTQFAQNISAIKAMKPHNNRYEDLQVTDENIINPSRWN